MPKQRKKREVYATEEERLAALRESKRLSAQRARKRQAALKFERMPKDARPSKKAKKEWAPSFVGVDGESFVTSLKLPDGEQAQEYSLLLRNDLPSLVAEDYEKGFSTFQVLSYLTQRKRPKTAYIGFFLNFDFEWWLKDLTEEEYLRLHDGEEVSIYADRFRLQWFAGKKLDIYRLKDTAFKIPHDERKIGKHFSLTSIQDVQGFFQTSFVNALKKWGFKDDQRLEVITSGKAARGGFKWEDLAEVTHYNATEMELLEELMIKVHDSFKAAYEKAGLAFKVHSMKWSGPGVFANDFLKQTHFNEEHVLISEKMAADFAKGKAGQYGNDIAERYPFSLAYFGGRIELAGIGKFGKGFNYDINSAYPYALSLLPKWKEKDFKRIKNPGNPFTDKKAKKLVERRAMGMYKIMFHIDEEWDWYPFPVRMKDYQTDNVFYPNHGITYVMAPELFAALDTLPEECFSMFRIMDALIIDGTDGYGDALHKMPHDKLCTTAQKTQLMADVRLEAKAASKRLGTPDETEEDEFLSLAEKALKLILNSLYGKTVQQVGSHKYYNDFVSAWITSTCRALLWRAIAPERNTGNVVMTMTDGVYSLKPLPFAAERLTKHLGDWEETHFDWIESFKPGIYRYFHDGAIDYKVRGFYTKTLEDKERLFELIDTAIKHGAESRFPSVNFLPRTVARHGWKREPWLRQFYKDMKDIKSDLSAKRGPGSRKWLIPEGQENAMFPPKGRYNPAIVSVGYKVSFEPMEVTEENADVYLRLFNERNGSPELYTDEPI